MYFLSVSVHSNRQPSVSISGFRANRGIQRLPWPPRLLWHPAPPVAFISQLSARIERDLIHFSARIPLRLSAPSRTASTPLLSIIWYPNTTLGFRVLLRYSCASQRVSPKHPHSTFPSAPAIPKQATVGTRSPQLQTAAVDAIDSEGGRLGFGIPCISRNCLIARGHVLSRPATLCSSVLSEPPQVSGIAASLQPDLHVPF